jgi:hypothetical protein
LISLGKKRRKEFYTEGAESTEDREKKGKDNPPSELRKFRRRVSRGFAEEERRRAQTEVRATV